MLRNRKSRPGLRLSFILTSLSAMGSWVATASDDVPVGYKADRYQKVWERNPFTLVTPVATAPQAKVFDKFVLLSWLNDGGTDVVFVQNIETNEVQKITKDPNSNSLRLVAIHKAADPKNADVLLSNGAEEGSVKFRLEAAVPAPQSPTGQQPAVQNAGVQPPGAPVPGVPRQAQIPQNAQPTVRAGANQQGTAQMPPGSVVPPRASEIRRKRLTAPPTVEQPVGVPPPAQNIPSQPQTQ
jgi:hypothetical protein